jgi:CheY-like chemotaxis protein
MMQHRPTSSPTIVPTILLVDDDVALLATLATQLEEAGYHTCKASDVRQAERTFREQKPDLVLLEVDIAHPDGWLLLERLAPLVPVIVLSGLGLEEQVVRGLDAGAADYVTRPYRSGELLARIRARLGAYRPTVSAMLHEGMPAAAFDSSDGAFAETPSPEAALKPSDGAAGPETLAPALPPGPAALPKWAEQAPAEPSPPTRAPLAAAQDDEDEPVFMDIASEARMLAEARAPRQPRPLDENLARLPLGARLNTARRQRNLSLVQVENDTHIRMWYIQAMEEEKFALLPRGESSEQLVRSYAAYLGLDAAAAAEEYRRAHFNPVVAPPQALGGALRPRNIPRWPFLLLAALLAVVVSVALIAYLDPQGWRSLVESLTSLTKLTFQP